MQSLDTVSEDLVDSITALREQVCGDWGVYCNCVAVSSLTLISILKLYLNYIKQSSYTVVISFCQILFNLLVVYGLHEQYIYYHVKRGYRLIDQPG